MSKRDVGIILKDILNEINRIERFIKDVDYETFISDDMRYYAVIRCLEVIGEAVRQLPEEFKKKHNEIELRKIIDLRDVLIHQYFGIKPEHLIEEILKGDKGHA